jgi:hypothetical protein
MLLPFVRLVIGCLLALTVLAAILDVARIHMVVLSVLSSGLLLSLSFFESEFKKARGMHHSQQQPMESSAAGKDSNKTD